MDIRYSYADAPTLAAFASSNARIRGINGPFRSGKSSASVAEIVRRGTMQRAGTDGVARTRWLVIRNTFQQLEDSTIKTVMMWLPPEHFGKYTQHNHAYIIKALRGPGGCPCEIEIWFRALDRPDHVRNLLSVEVTGAWVNEAREVPWTIIDALTGRIGMYPSKAMGGVSWFGMWMDTNPPSTDSEWYKFFEEPEAPHDPEDVRIFQQPSGLSLHAENLTNLNSPDYYKVLARGKRPEWIKVYIEGKYGFLVEGKPIYPDFSDYMHLTDDDPLPGVTIVRSWDYGLQPACAFSQLLPDGRWLTFDEMVSKDMSIDRFSDDVNEHCARSFRGNVTFEDWGDPAGEQRAQTDARTCFDIQHAKGINVQGSIQTPQLRWESVAKPLRTIINGKPQFMLHRRCQVLHRGFLGGYHRRQLKVSGEVRYSEEAEKNRFSHIHDALQYGMAQYFAAGLTTAPGYEDDYPTREGPDYAALSTRSSVTGY